MKKIILDTIDFIPDIFIEEDLDYHFEFNICLDIIPVQIRIIEIKINRGFRNISEIRILDVTNNVKLTVLNELKASDELSGSIKALWPSLIEMIAHKHKLNHNHLEIANLWTLILTKFNKLTISN